MRKIITALFAICIAQSGCSSEQLYAVGRQAQRNECMKQTDQTSRSRCLQDAGMSHDTYEKESNAARNLAEKSNQP
jgi:hypothetical protein